MEIRGCDDKFISYLIITEETKYKVLVLKGFNWTFVARCTYEELMILTDELGIIWP